MAISQQKVFTQDLEVGMFVCNLDRPWCETPFSIQGFYIENASDVTKLSGLCNHVYVDILRARIVDEKTVIDINTKPKKRWNGDEKRNTHRELFIPSYHFTRNTYPVVSAADQEIRHAQKIQNEVYGSIETLMKSVGSSGCVDMTKTRQTAKKMVDSIVRNPDAFVWLSRLKMNKSHSYSQSVNASIWAIVFGRHLGLKKKSLEALATGLLLAKIGKINSIEGLSGERSYVEESIDILKRTPGISKSILLVVAYHQERLNGSGFPRGISGEDIPILGRIASLVNFYEERINPESGSALSPSEAMAQIYKYRNRLFQQDLGEEFIKAIGVYPVGTIVELTNNEVGIVMEQNEEKKLHPKIMMLLNQKKSIIRRKRVLNLCDEIYKDENPVSIRRTLPVGSFDMDISKLCHAGHGWKPLSTLSQWCGSLFEA